jgi:hypothetical protein
MDMLQTSFVWKGKIADWPAISQTYGGVWKKIGAYPHVASYLMINRWI